jgi:NADPH:quinone reductase-like Zn-dependent oxidoreductase
MKAIQIEAYGDPAEVVKVVDLPDVGLPAAGEVVIEVEASPVNPYELMRIAGGYGYRPRLPAIMGTEGGGRAVAVGAGVKHLSSCQRSIRFLSRAPRAGSVAWAAPSSRPCGGAACRSGRWSAARATGLEPATTGSTG